MAALEHRSRSELGDWLAHLPHTRAVWCAWLRGEQLPDASVEAEWGLAAGLSLLFQGDPTRSAAAFAAEGSVADSDLLLWRSVRTFATWSDGSAGALHELYEAAILAEDTRPGTSVAALAWLLAGQAHIAAGVRDAGKVAVGRAETHARRDGATDLELLSILAGARIPGATPDELRAAVARVAGVRQAAIRVSAPLIGVRAGAVEAELLELLGDRAAARIRSEGALLRARSLPPGEDRVRAAASAARLRLATGDDVGARAAVGVPLDWMAGPAVPSWGWRIARPALAIAAITRDVEMAQVWYRLMRRLFHAGRVPFEAVRIEADACIALAGGDQHRFEEASEHALRLWRLCGRQDMVESLLEAPEEEIDPYAHHAALTRRERQVARLVASRMTNAEVAETLQVSVRTAEHHVASILRKLGVASRYDLASFADRRTH